MDRLRRVLTHGAFVLMLGTVVAGTGCRSTEKVPPGKPYSTTGAGSGSLQFNSDPRPNTAVSGAPYGNGMVPGMPGSMSPGGSPGLPPNMDGPPSGMGSAPAQLGTPGPNSSSFSAPTNNLYGGTTGTATPNSPYGSNVR